MKNAIAFELWECRMKHEIKVEMEIKSAEKYWHKQSTCLLDEITDIQSGKRERRKNVVGIAIGWKLNAICTLSSWCFDLASVLITNTNAFALIFAPNISLEMSYFMFYVKWQVSWKVANEKKKEKYIDNGLNTNLFALDILYFSASVKMKAKREKVFGRRASTYMKIFRK